jgi:dihydrofolate reductase
VDVGKLEEESVTAKIVVTQYISLDGVIEDPVGMEDSGLGDWTGPFTRGADGDRFKQEELFAAESLIFGRSTYEAFASAWPHIQDTTGYAARINGLPKLVASTSLAQANWGPTQVVADDLIGTVTRHRARTRGDALIFGSASVVHALAAAGLIDEYRLMIYPTILGRGKRLFARASEARLALLEARQFGDGISLLRYAVESTHASRSN